jgi:hypothetical protein
LFGRKIIYPKADYRHRILIEPKELEKLFEFLVNPPLPQAPKGEHQQHLFEI